MIRQKPWAEMSRGEKLAENANKALNVAAKILDLEVDANDPAEFKRLVLQKDMAVQVIGYQIRVEQGPQPLSPPAEPSVSLKELAEQAAREIDLAFREFEPPATERASTDTPVYLPPAQAQPQEADRPARDYSRTDRMSAVTLDEVVSRGRRSGRRTRRPGSSWGM